MKLHAHYESAARDCDGLITQDYIIVPTDEERASEFGDIEFTDRVVANMVNAYSLDSTGTLVVNKLDDGDFRLAWSEPTEEGYRSVDVTLCKDDCDLGEHSYRDHTAESMGY